MASRIHLTPLGMHWRRGTVMRPWTQRRSVSTRSVFTKPRTVIWRDVDLETCQDYPLSRELKKEIKPRVQHSKSNQKYIRPQIVSPDLCDDTISYIGPSLEQYKGCDILDINPGAGLWSQKLHEYLQPRTHVFLEPSPKEYQNFLKPLVDAPGSKYRLVARDPCEFATYDDLVEKCFPNQKPVDESAPESQVLNTSLLVTGTLAWSPKLPGLGFDSMSKQILMHHLPQSWKNKGIHSCGPVRMLLWLAHEEGNSILPRSELHIAKTSFTIDRLSSVTQVVTGEHTPRLPGRGTLGRGPELELESITRALKSGREKGMVLPAHRRENIHDFAADIERMTGGSGRLTKSEMFSYLMEQERAGKSTTGVLTVAAIEGIRLEQEFEQNPDQFFVDKIGKSGNVRRVLTTEGKGVSRQRAAFSQQQRIREKIEGAVNIGEEAYHLECKILGMPDGAAREQALKELEMVEERFAQAVVTVEHNHRMAIESVLDDRLALIGPVSRLQWDRRPFEPLVMRQEEVWPRTSLSLFQFEPRPRPEGRLNDWNDWVTDFSWGLLPLSASPLETALEKMQHGASQIIDHVPALSDPAQGGRLKMSNFRVRMLTSEMLDGLCKAYHDWPFRSPEANHFQYFRLKGSEYSKLHY